MFIKVDECMLAIVFLFLIMLGIICPTKSRSHYIIMYTFRNSQWRDGEQRAEKRTGSHHENHSKPPRIMYAVKLDAFSLVIPEWSPRWTRFSSP